MNTQLRRWMADGPTPRSDAWCRGARVALVGVEPPPGVVLGLGPHDAVAGHLGQDRGRGDRQAAGVAPTSLSTMPPPTKSHLPSSSTRSGARPMPARARRAARRWAALMPSSSHSSALACPTPQAVHHPAMRSNSASRPLGELLGVPHLVDPAVPRQHGGADRQRPGPGAPPHLVDADDDVVAGLPQPALVGQRRRPALQRPAQRGGGGGHRGETSARANLPDEAAQRGA